MKYPEGCIVLFAREPVEGKVKTRLIPVLGSKGAMELHCQLIQNQLEILSDSNISAFELWVEGNPRHPVFENNRDHGRYRQLGADLGEKLHTMAIEVLGRSQQLVIIGSDCPWIDEAYLDDAFSTLKQGIDVVIGPASDGGYVLIGMSRVLPDIFRDINWGTEEVLTQTRQRLQQANLQWGELAELADIDRPEDLLKIEDFAFPACNIRVG